MADKISSAQPRPMPTNIKSTAPTTPNTSVGAGAIEEIANLQAAPAATISVKASLVTTAPAALADLPLQPVKRVGNAASYGTDFGHGQTGGPRFRVFIPADPLPAKP